MQKYYSWETLNVGQYYKLINQPENMDSKQLLEILTGKSSSKLTIQEINSIKIGDLTPKSIHPFPKICEHDGKYYGLVDMDTMSYGEFIDLLDYAKEMQKNLISVVALLYRPIVHMGTLSYLKIRLASALLNRKKPAFSLFAIKLLSSIKYKIEEYDTVKCDMREKEIKQFPAWTAHYASTFFLMFYQQFATDSLKSFQAQLKEMIPEAQKQREEVTTSIKESLEKIFQDGTGSLPSGFSPEKDL